MQIGMIGLGRMGGDMVLRLMAGGQSCVVYARRPEAMQPFVAKGAVGAATLEEYWQNLARGRDCVGSPPAERGDWSAFRGCFRRR